MTDGLAEEGAVVPTRWWIRTACAGCLVVVGFASMACSDGEPSAGDPTTTAATAAPATTVAATTTTARPAPGSPEDAAAVIAHLRRDWEVLLALFGAPDPLSPELEVLETGEELEVNRGLLRQDAAKGHSSRRSSPGPYSVGFSDVAFDSEFAFLYECVINDAVKYDSSGKILNDEVVAIEYRTSLQRQADGSWRVSKREPILRSKDTAHCAGW
jgi:hypothetical protein